MRFPNKRSQSVQRTDSTFHPRAARCRCFIRACPSSLRKQKAKYLLPLKLLWWLSMCDRGGTGLTVGTHVQQAGSCGYPAWETERGDDVAWGKMMDQAAREGSPTPQDAACPLENSHVGVAARKVGGPIALHGHTRVRQRLLRSSSRSVSVADSQNCPGHVCPRQVLAPHSSEPPDTSRGYEPQDADLR